MTRYLQNAFWVVPQGNDFILYDNNGNEIPKQITIRVTSEYDSYPEAFIKCIVNIAKDKEEMLAKIEELNKPIIHG